MRIACWHNLPSGGGRRLLADHLAYLLASGHELRIWTTPQSHDDIPALPAGLEVRVVPLDLRWERRQWSALPPGFVVDDRLRAMGRHLDAVAAEVDSWAPDVVFANACRLLRTVDLGTRTAAPSVLYLGEPYRWLYEAMPTVAWTSSGRSGLRRFTYRLDRAAWGRQVAAETRAAFGFDRVLVNSLFSRESVLRAYGLDASICYPGVDLPAADPRPPADPAYVISVGALAPEKRPELVIDAMSRLEHRDVPLVWVANAADPTYAAHVRSVAAAAGVRFDLRLRITDAELRPLVAGATALAYAPQLEPFGLVPIEAAAASVPTVAVAEGGVRETVRDGVTGLLVASASEMAAGLDRLIDDHGLRSRLGSAARTDAVNRWSARDAGSRLERHLLDVGSGHQVDADVGSAR